MINKLVFLFVFLMMLAGCQSRQTIITFTSPDMQLTGAKLKIGNLLFEESSDSSNIVRFKLDNIPTGYAILQFRNTRKMIFLEQGKDLTIRFNRTTKPNVSRYNFEGKGAPENNYMEQQSRLPIISLNANSTEEEIIRQLNDTVNQRKVVLQSLDLSPEFKRLESERQRYSILRSFSRYNGWGNGLYSFLKDQLAENPELLITEDYQAFLLDALYAIGGESGKNTPYSYTAGQLDYIDQHLKDTTVIDFVLNSVLSKYMEKCGTESIDGFMEIFRTKARSHQVIQSIEELYGKYNRIAKGQALPEFTFLDVNDKEVALSSFKGKYVYIDCWATWCGPCNLQIPALQQLEHKYKGKDIIFVSISRDSNRDKWKSMIQKRKLSGVQLIEKLPTHSEFSDWFMINAIPRFIILDKTGNVYDMNAPRPSDPITEQILDKLLVQ
ncbi:MAG TPA: redoxin family protein [Candidatus Butyricimonas faecavium]|nr:redoxin family protein [Candidatus Butyricimonas faecavium]